MANLNWGRNINGGKVKGGRCGGNPERGPKVHRNAGNVEADISDHGRWSEKSVA